MYTLSHLVGNTWVACPTVRLSRLTWAVSLATDWSNALGDRYSVVDVNSGAVVLITTPVSRQS